MMMMMMMMMMSKQKGATLNKTIDTTTINKNKKHLVLKSVVRNPMHLSSSSVLAVSLPSSIMDVVHPFQKRAGPVCLITFAHANIAKKKTGKKSNNSQHHQLQSQSIYTPTATPTRTTTTTTTRMATATTTKTKCQCDSESEHTAAKLLAS